MGSVERGERNIALRNIVLLADALESTAPTWSVTSSLDFQGCLISFATVA